MYGCLSSLLCVGKTLMGCLGALFFKNKFYWYSQFFKKKSDFIELFLILSQKVK